MMQEAKPRLIADDSRGTNFLDFARGDTSFATPFSLDSLANLTNVCPS